MTFSRTEFPAKLRMPTLLGWAFLLFGAVTALAKDDPVSLLQRHRYEEAIAIWTKELQASRTGESAMRALKGQGIAYLRMGSLYESLHKFSLSIMQDYYEQVAESGLTPTAALYLGQIHFAQGNTAKAKSWFEKAKENAPEAVQDMANVYLQAMGGAVAAPKTVDAQWQAVELKEGSKAESMGAAPISARSRRCQLSLLARALYPNREALEKALARVLQDGQEPELVQDAGKNSQINFYDPELLITLARANFAMGKAVNLELAAQEAKSPSLAAKFKTPMALAEVCMRLNQVDEAEKYLGKEMTNDAQLLRAQILARRKKTKDAQEALEAMASKAGRNALLKRDIAEVYYLSSLNPDRGLQLIDQALRDRNGPTFYRVQAGLLMAKGQGEAAIQQYAKGYKIEFRNRIDQIDPEYMVEYSFALYRNNKLRYEEIVETLYHLQKEFPPSRQMHYCMQGVSAGLARSFEAQRIFRKGG
jgi:tetratricopeptide (TPR) repeat protein